MDQDLRDTLQKLAWLELYAPVEGATQRLAERMVRRTARRAVLPEDATTTYTDDNRMPENTEHMPMEAAVVPSESFSHKVAKFNSTYERR